MGEKISIAGKRMSPDLRAPSNPASLLAALGAGDFGQQVILGWCFRCCSMSSCRSLLVQDRRKKKDALEAEPVPPMA